MFCTTFLLERLPPGGNAVNLIENQVVRMPSLEDRSGLQRKVAAKPSEGDRVTINLSRYILWLKQNLQPHAFGRNSNRSCRILPQSLRDSSLPEGATETTSFLLKLTALPPGGSVKIPSCADARFVVQWIYGKSRKSQHSGRFLCNLRKPYR